MKKNKLLIFSIILFLYGNLFSKILPEDRTYNWFKAGLAEEFSFTDTLNVVELGLDNSGMESNSVILNDILDTLSQKTVLYFPAGNYLFTESIKLKSNIALLGENPFTTKFFFDCGGRGDLISINGGVFQEEIELVADIRKNSNFCIVNDDIFEIGDYVYIYDSDEDKITSEWAKNSTGQILKIVRKNGDSIFFDLCLRRNYYLKNSPKIKLIEPVENVFISSISIIRLDSTATQTSHLKFNYAVNSKILCVICENCNFSHVDIRFSKNIVVEGCYFKNAFSFGGGGRAYGVMLHFGTSDCLIYNNIFEKLRHSMIVQAGANGNVFSYNYSLEPYWTEVMLPSDAAGDIVCHGNYPYANLFEGNICQNIVIDDSHGKNGPHNTFFRNRAEKYGIFMNNNPSSDGQSFIGNEVVNTKPFYGLYLLSGNDHFEYGNNVKGKIIPNNTNDLSDSSLYLKSVLEWYKENEHFPPIGIPNELLSYVNEAYVRYNNSEFVACYNTNTGYEDRFNFSVNYNLFPNPANENLCIDFGKDIFLVKQVLIINSLGKVVSDLKPEIIGGLLCIDLALYPKGIYEVIIINSLKNQVFKFIKY